MGRCSVPALAHARRLPLQPDCEQASLALLATSGRSSDRRTAHNATQPSEPLLATLKEFRAFLRDATPEQLTIIDHINDRLHRLASCSRSSAGDAGSSALRRLQARDLRSNHHRLEGVDVVGQRIRSGRHKSIAAIAAISDIVNQRAIRLARSAICAAFRRPARRSSLLQQVGSRAPIVGAHCRPIRGLLVLPWIYMFRHVRCGMMAGFML
jgi:hypothetical protein